MAKTFDELIYEYENLTDGELADEFVKIDAYIQLLWKNTPQEVSDRWDVLVDMIHERFVEKFASSYIFVVNSEDVLK